MSTKTTTKATKDAPAFDFYPERWLVGVAGMSDAEQISYLRLLCHQWLLGDAGLPPDLPALKRLAGKGVTPAVLAKLPLSADGNRRNARLEVVRAEQRDRIVKSREKIAKMNAARAAGKGALAKGGKAPMGDDRAFALQEGLQGDLQDDLQDVLQGGHGEEREEGLQGGLEGCLGEGLEDDLGGALERPLNGFLTSHHSPPTPVPEDANNAGAREAGAAVDAPALEAADAQAAADALPDEAAAAPQPRTDAEVPEPPPNLPRVLSWAAGIGCPPDKAEIWWNEHEARPLSLFGRWTDRDGNAVRRPQNALAAWWQKWQANDHQRSTRNHPGSTTFYHGNARPGAVRSDSANAPGRYA